MHRFQLLPGSQRCIILVQNHLQASRDQAIIDRTEPGGLLRVMRPHIVQQTVRMRNVGDRHLLSSSFVLRLRGALLQCNMLLRVASAEHLMCLVFRDQSASER